MLLHACRRGAAPLASSAAACVASAARLRDVHTWDDCTSGAAVVIAPPPELNHERLRASTLISRQFVRGPAASVTAAGGNPPAEMQPSPASQMCQTMAFGYSMFFKDRYLRPDLLARSVVALAGELPATAARVRPPKGPPGLRKMADTVLDLNNAGIEFVLAETNEHGIEDLGPRTWTAGMSGRTLDSFGVPFYAEPFSTAAMYQGKEALFKVKLTRCRDGHIVSVTVNHILADAGRAVRLVERLGELYNSLVGGRPAGPPLCMNSQLETPHGFAAALKGAAPQWEQEAPDHGLTMRQWAVAPYRMYRQVKSKHDMHLLYLPRAAMQRLKALAAGDASDGTSDGSSKERISTMDAVQAFVATLVADLRNKILVPTAPEEFTVNVDLLHRDQPFKDPQLLARHVGNAVHILHVPGVPPGTAVPTSTAGCGQDDRAIAEQLTAELRMNARLIRRSVAAFRSDPNNTLRALERQARLVAMPEGRMGAAFVVKGADMKVASTTAVTAFPFDTIDFGIGPVRYAQINYQPRFDWWTIVQAAQGYGDGVLCSMTVESGLQRRLVTHPAWRLLAPEAHLIVADAEEERQRRMMKEAAANAEEKQRREEECRETAASHKTTAEKPKRGI